MARIKNWTKMTPEQLWNTWREQFDSDDESIVTAIWIANRLVKNKAYTTKNNFYSIKDEFLFRYSKLGQRVRDESAFCRECDGSGIAFGHKCFMCQGTGIHEFRWLYVHHLEIAGRAYSLHSRVPPEIILDGLGENKESYGGRFTAEEQKELELPVSGFIILLSYVGIQKWGMRKFGYTYNKNPSTDSEIRKRKKQEEVWFNQAGVS